MSTDPDIVADTAAAGHPGRLRGAIRVLATVGAWLCLLVALLGLGSHYLDSEAQPLILLAAASWVLGLVVVPALILLLLTRRWASTIVVVLVAAAQVVVYAPMFVAEPAPAGDAITVMTQNARYGRADPSQIVSAAASNHVDVLVVQELTQRLRDRLLGAGIGELFPYSRLAARGGAGGLGLWSRFPLQDPQRLPPQLPGGLISGVEPPGGPTFTVVSVHLAAPWPENPQDWLGTLAQTRRLLGGLGHGPVLVAGDFNATSDQARFRALLHGGWVDAADQAGAGFVRTWPADRPVPPLLGLDHVLGHGVVATKVRTVSIAGTDHRGLVVTLTIPADQAGP